MHDDAVNHPEHTRLCQCLVKLPFHVINNLFRHKKCLLQGTFQERARVVFLFGLANFVIATNPLLTLHARDTS